MNTIIKRLLSTFLGLALLAGGFAGATWFKKSKPEAKRARPMSSMIPVVESTPLRFSNHTVNVEALGTVIPDKEAILRPEVTGRIVHMNPNLVEGARINTGDVLLKIDTADYLLALQEAKAQVLTARANLRIEEGQQDVARHELELMGTNETDSYQDLMLREPQKQAAEAALLRAVLMEERAELNLERCTIAAPFDGVVLSANADVGNYAQPSTVLAHLAATDRYFVRASVPLQSLNPLPKLNETPYPATLILPDGSTRDAHTHHLLPDLSEKGRMARILFTVPTPLDPKSGRALLLNEVVQIRIHGKPVENATLLPRKFLRDGQTVWLRSKKGTLKIRSVETLQGYKNELLIHLNIDPGDELITSDLISAVEGMKLRTDEENQKAQP